MILTVLKLRLFQFFRVLKEIGLIRIIILSLLFCIVPILVYHFLVPPKNTIKWLIVIGLLLLITHLYRKDNHFLKIIIENPYPIYLGEYFLLTLPFFIIWIINTNWIGLSLLIIIVFIIPVINIKIILQYFGSIIMLLLNPLRNLNSKFTVSLPFISIHSFEWISGIRRNFLVLAPVYLFFVALSFMSHIAEVGLIFLSLLISTFYFHGESREFIELLAKNPREFLLKKILTNFKQLFVVYTPIVVIGLIFQTPTWYFLVGALIISFSIQAYTIVFKYGLFEENANLNRNIVILFAIFLFIGSDEFFLVPLILGIRSYNRAIENLKPYFYD